ncbi:hypothetical protein ACFFOS_27920 [Nocardioides kongjuensis]|uniref:Uncharacterized protein n=1 Tax=Nocardioides kongjuensis TaxID=349522 RepID=A0A852S147_9ACTN|nr:hypothetical protein [Nocardioides kongjuensis]NYD33834.1 hypothetical protein [Nocardioides kongjuensis]
MTAPAAHVWVRKPHVPMSWPGLVVDRRRAADGSWEALVIYIDRMTVRDKVIQEWVPYSWLTPATEGRPGIGSAYG